MGLRVVPARRPTRGLPVPSGRRGKEEQAACNMTGRMGFSTVTRP